MRRGAPPRAVHAPRRATGPHSADARTPAGLQRLPVGGADADRRRRHAAPRPAPGACDRRRRAEAARRSGAPPVISLDDGPPAAERRRATALPAPRPEWAYFFDIDGTLVDLADSPRAVRLDAVLRQLVERLYHATGGAVALISGRAIADVDDLFPGTRFPAAGQHGTERRDAAGHLSY